MKAKLLLVALCLNGCSHVDVSPSISQTDKKLASQEYWLAMPASAVARHDNYDELWEACIGAARWKGYHVDRSDYRGGSMTMFPLVNKQFFELWKRDISTVYDISESSLTTMRRIVRFEIDRRDEGTFECVPKILVERYSSTEARITSVTRYRDSFSLEPNQGSRERDKGNDIPDAYWYTVGRDDVLEKDFVEAINSRLHDMVARR